MLHSDGCVSRWHDIILYTNDEKPQREKTANKIKFRRNIITYACMYIIQSLNSIITRGTTNTSGCERVISFARYMLFCFLWNLKLNKREKGERKNKKMIEENNKKLMRKKKSTVDWPWGAFLFNNFIWKEVSSLLKRCASRKNKKQESTTLMQSSRPVYSFSSTLLICIRLRSICRLFFP